MHEPTSEISVLSDRELFDLAAISETCKGVSDEQRLRLEKIYDELDGEKMEGKAE